MGRVRLILILIEREGFNKGQRGKGNREAPPLKVLELPVHSYNIGTNIGRDLRVNKLVTYRNNWQ